MREENEMNQIHNPELQFEELSLDDMHKSADNLTLRGTITMEQLEETKRVFDMNEKGVEKSVKKANSISKTKKEYENIAKVLEREKEKGEFRNETTARLETRQGRNLSHMLLNSTKMFGDSDEMRDVKQSVREIEEALVTSRDAETAMSLEEINALENKYLTALNYCQHYISVKTTHTGSARYELVLAKMNQLMDELALISTMKDIIGVAEYEDYLKADCPYSLLVGAKILKMSGVQLTKENAENDGNESTEEEIQGDKAEVFTKEELDSMDQPAAKIARLLTMMSKPQDIVSKAGTDDYDITIYLYNMLKNFPKGAHAEFINSGTVAYKGEGYKRTYKDNAGKKVVAGTLIGIVQSADGKLTLRVGDLVREIPYSREAIIGSTTVNIVDNEKIFGKECVNDTMSWLGNENDNTDLIVARNTSLKIIKNRLGITPTEFNNVSTENVKAIAYSVMKGDFTAEEVKLVLEKLEKSSEATSKLINGQETLELLNFRRANLSKLREKVVMPERQETRSEILQQEQWSQDELEAKKLLSDMIYSKDTWESDENIGKEGIRMQKALVDNSYAVYLLIKNKNLASNLINKLPVPADSKAELIGEFENFRSAAVKDKQMGIAILGLGGRRVISKAVSKFVNKPEVVEELAKMEKRIDEMVEQSTEHIQTEISERVDRLFAKPEDEEEQQTVNPDLVFEDIGLYVDKKGLGDESRKRVEAEGAAELDNILMESMKGDTGQGKFTKLVLKNYFTGVSTLDKRSMFASIIRDAQPSEDEEMTDESAGIYLGAIFKGAGPLLQKMLQGMPLQGIPDSLRGAFDAVKSNLLPIPQEIVEAQLLSMVERSNGAVTKIEVARALGAASVGQAFLCKIYGPSLPQDGKEVVIKLLRPDVRNRMMREKKIMLEQARNTDENGGMLRTYEGQLERIEEELDLTIEARNVELGQIYNKSRNPNTDSDSVSSMKLNSLIMPTTNSMVIEKSPGTTVDKYMNSLKEEMRNELDTLLVKDEEGEPILGEKGEYKIKIDENNFALAGHARAELSKKLESAQKRQKHLVILAEKWVQEGLFGEGFYHGDLHAGNIMIDDDCATVIDFGNATQLDEEQKGYVTRMMSAAFIGDYKLFCEGYHALMHKDERTEQHFKEHKVQFEKTMREVLNLGTGDSTGQRIGVALVKAQELGFELPSAIFNFSQCQLRLQNTIEDLNKQIIIMQKTLDNFIDELNGPMVEIDMMPAMARAIATSPNTAKDIILNAKLQLSSRTKEDFLKEFDDTSDQGIADFENLLLDPAFRETPYTSLMEKVNELYEKKRNNPELDITDEIQKNADFKYFEKKTKKGSGLIELINSTEDTRTRIDEYLSEYKDTYDVYTTYDKLRAIQRGEQQIDDPEEIAKLKDKMYVQWDTIRSSTWNGVFDRDVNGVVGDPTDTLTFTGNMVTQPMVSDEMLQAYIDKYSTSERFGQQLIEAGQRILELRQMRKDEENKNNVTRADMTAANKQFSAVVENIMSEKILELVNINVPGGEMAQFATEEPRNFMHVMASVLSENVAKMIKRLGVWGVSHASDFTI